MFAGCVRSSQGGGSKSVLADSTVARGGSRKRQGNSSTLELSAGSVSFGFKENIVDRCIYLKVSGSKFIFLILYVDDILLATKDLGLLSETKKFLSNNFEMKDMGEA